MSGNRPQRIASHDDDPNAPLADRLMLALGMWPSYVEELGVDAVLDAAVEFRTNSHRLQFAAEDYGIAAEERDVLRSQLSVAEARVAELERVLTVVDQVNIACPHQHRLDPPGPCGDCDACRANEALAAALSDNRPEPEGDTDVLPCPGCGFVGVHEIGCHRPEPGTELCTWMGLLPCNRPADHWCHNEQQAVREGYEWHPFARPTTGEPEG